MFELSDFIEKALGPETQALLAVSLVQKCRQHNHAAFKAIGFKGGKHLQAAHVRHLNIKRDNVRPKAADHGESLDAIRSFADDFHSGNITQRDIQKLANSRRIIDDKQAERPG